MITPLYKDVYNIIKEAFDFSSAIDDNDELIITLDKKDIIPYINDRLQQLFPEKNDEKTICLITHTELIDYNFITINGSIYIIYTCWHSTDEELNTMPYINDVEQTYFIKYADNEFQQPCP